MKTPFRLTLLLSAALLLPAAPAPAATAAMPSTAPAGAAAPINATPVAAPAASGVWYEIFVRSWYDTNGDGIGDLNGVTAKLDYLKSLGVDGIWLMPINPSPSYHGYDVTDYEAINPQYGTLADFERLVKEAHRRGIKVVMDLVINHTSDESPWFKAARDPHSKYHNWYIWASRNTDLNAISANHTPAWHDYMGQHYLSVFPGGMPDLNYDDQAVRREMIKVGRFWLKQGVDGFRLDAARFIYIDMKSDLDNPHALAKNLVWWSEFRKAMRESDPNVLLFGELWVHSESQLAPYYAALDSAFNYPLLWKLTESAGSEQSVSLGRYLHDAHVEFDRQADGPAIDAPFLSNHDQVRVMSVLHGNIEHMHMAAAMLLTLPGNPFIYYGEEIGMYGSKPDSQIRQPMRWERDTRIAGETRWEAVTAANASPSLSVAAEQTDPHSLLNFYRMLIHWRAQLPALRDGGIDAYPADGGAISAYVRADRMQRLLVMHNLSSAPHCVELQAGSFSKIIMRTKDDIHLNSHVLCLPSYSTAILQ